MSNLAIYDKVTYLEHLTKTNLPYFELNQCVFYDARSQEAQWSGSFIVDNVLKSLLLSNFPLLCHQSAHVESRHH